MKVIDLRTLKNDIVIYKKIMDNPKYIDKLEKVDKIVTTLEIQDESLYYQYQIVLKSLEGFNYFEATFLKRINDDDYLIDTIKHLTQNGIPVMGHLGFTPMSINSLGGHKIQGKDADRTIDILKDALKLQNAGCFAIVLELMPDKSAQYITQRINIPTIGIGAGVDCDGQILVSDDILGKYDRFKPKFARQYVSLKDIILNAAKQYCVDVENASFPNVSESFELEYKEVCELENHK